MKSRSNYRKELVEAAAEAAVEIMQTDRTGLRWPVVATVALLERAWMAGHAAGVKTSGNRREHERD